MHIKERERERERERETSALGLLRETDLEDDADEVHLLVYGSNGVPYLKELVVIIHHLSLQNPFFLSSEQVFCFEPVAVACICYRFIICQPFFRFLLCYSSTRIY